MAIDIRPIDDGEIPAFRRAAMTTFGVDLANDPRAEERYRAILDPGRMFAAFDRGAVVATAATFDFTLTIPGGSAPMAGLTMVTVRPTHRRRGLLRALMAAHVDEARGRGVAVSGLWASESGIYGRFGYGVAAEGDDLAVATAGLEIAAAPADEVEQLDDPTPAALPPVYDAVRATRPGMLTRTPAWWHYRRFADRPDVAHGASPRRHVLARRDGAATGYVTYRHRPSFEAGLATGRVEIDELVAIDARAEATLWRFVTAIDLFPNVAWSNAPVDAILPWIASDRRRVQRRRADTLWLLLDDVAAALEARSYGEDGVLRLELLDAPATIYELRVDGGAARCTRSDGEPDLRVARAGLASLYLGAAPAALLVRAGQVAGAPAAVARAGRMFATAAAPWCTEQF